RYRLADRTFQPTSSEITERPGATCDRAHNQTKERDMKTKHGHTSPRDTGSLDAGRRKILTASLQASALSVLGWVGFTPAAYAQAGRKIKIGYVTPLTGPLAGFGEVDRFVLDQL